MLSLNNALSQDDAIAFDEEQFGHISRLTWRPLRILLDLLARNEAHWKIHAVVSDEVRDQVRGVGVVSRRENL